MHTSGTGELSTQKFGGHTQALDACIILGLLAFTCMHRHEVGWIALSEHTKNDRIATLYGV